MRWLVLTLVLWAMPIRAQEPLKGYDVLALAKYCDTFLRAPKLPAVSTLLNTFGDPLPCIERRIQQGGLKLVQVDLIDATCWRNNKCPAGVPRPDDLRAIEKRAKIVYALAVKYPDVQFDVSFGLEHDIKDAKKVKQCLDTSKKGCPICGVVNSPFSGARVPGYDLELHGTKINADFISGDGASSFDADNVKDDGNKFQHRIAGKKATFIWWNELNLRTTGEKTFTPPLKRTVRPDADQFKQAFLIANTSEPAPLPPPRMCRKVHTVNGKEILKTNAEQYGNGVKPDARGNKPMLIIRKAGKRGEKMKVLSPFGREIGCFAYYGPYSERPLHRWYMGDCSKQTPAKLYKDAGGEWAYVVMSKTDCLRINTVRRMGLYR